MFSLKLDCEKLANEKTEMQRHYVMVGKIYLGLNIASIINVEFAIQRGTQRPKQWYTSTIVYIEQITRAKLP